jgi:hypothetical protein
MNGAIPPLPQYTFMAWVLVKVITQRGAVMTLKGRSPIKIRDAIATLYSGIEMLWQIGICQILKWNEVEV